MTPRLSNQAQYRMCRRRRRINGARSRHATTGAATGYSLAQRAIQLRNGLSACTTGYPTSQRAIRLRKRCSPHRCASFLSTSYAGAPAAVRPNIKCADACHLAKACLNLIVRISCSRSVCRIGHLFGMACENRTTHVLQHRTVYLLATVAHYRTGRTACRRL